MEHAGGCHCGNVRLTLTLSMPPDQCELRECLCAFCRSHGARTAADPAGLLSFKVSDPSKLNRYRFGLETADYLICAVCGVYVAALADTSAGRRATINVNCLNDRAAFTREPVAVSYEGETQEGRLKRRAEKWTPVSTSS
jgi:hypothetical protein